MDLAGGLDQVLQVGAGEEVAKVDEFAMSFIFTVDDAPSVLSTTDSTSVYTDCLLAADNGEWDQRLWRLVRGGGLPVAQEQVVTLICEFTAVSSASYSSFS